MTTPDRPGDRDQQQAAEFVRAIWWAGAVKAPTGRATDDLATALAAAREEGRAEAFEEAARDVDDGEFSTPWSANLRAHFLYRAAAIREALR